MEDKLNGFARFGLDLDEKEKPMDFLIPAAIAIFLMFFGVVFPFWMLVHSVVRTIKMWPEDSVLHILLIFLIFFANILGAVVYYFVCYRTSTEFVKQ